MAFRILTSDELALLTEQQRAYYEEELAVYNERVRFVEQIEKLENAEIQPYEPVLKPIPAVRKAPEFGFSAPAYTVARNNASTVSAPHKTVVFQDEITTALPCPDIVKPLHIKSDTIFEAPGASLPPVGVATVPETVFQKPDYTLSSSLTQQKKISAPVLCADTKKDTKCQLPDMAAVKIPEANSVSMPIINADDINSTTQITVPQVTDYTFTASDAVCTDIPQVQMASVQAPAITVPLDTDVKLPVSPAINTPGGSFVAPEVICARSTETNPIKVPHIELTAPSVSGSPLPEMEAVAIPDTPDNSRAISIPATVSSAIPVAPKKAYVAPSLAPTSVVIPSTPISPRIMRIPQQAPAAQVVCPSVDRAPAVDFRPVDGTPTHRPNIPTAFAPDIDANETVQKLRKSHT